MKKSIFHYFIYGNRAVVACMLFTMATMLDLTLCVIQGIADISYWHLGMRFVICISVSLSTLIFKHFEKVPLYAVILIHFLLSIGIMILFVWLSSLYSELHPNAYHDAIRTVLMAYPLAIAICAVVDSIKTIKANKILKRLN